MRGLTMCNVKLYYQPSWSRRAKGGLYSHTAQSSQLCIGSKAPQAGPSFAFGKRDMDPTISESISHHLSFTLRLNLNPYLAFLTQRSEVRPQDYHIKTYQEFPSHRMSIIGPQIWNTPCLR